MFDNLISSLLSIGEDSRTSVLLRYIDFELLGVLWARRVSKVRLSEWILIERCLVERIEVFISLTWLHIFQFWITLVHVKPVNLLRGLWHTIGHCHILLWEGSCSQLLSACLPCWYKATCRENNIRLVVKQRLVIKNRVFLQMASRLLRQTSPRCL